MKVDRAGTYLIDGSFEDFTSYARLTINDLNGKRRYQNKTGSTLFKVTVTALFPNPNSSVTGIGGSFEGILYNLENPADSITIKKGEFVFRKTNRYNFNQCKE
jgi:hypothetical protein